MLRQTLKPLGAAMAIGLLVLLAERMVRLLDTTLDKQNSFSVVFELLAYLIPHYLGLAIPAALFLGLLFGFNRLAKDSELDAWMAAGFGLHQLAKPVIVLSVLISIASLAIFGWIQPYARYAYRALIYNVSNVEVFYLAEAGIFMRVEGRTFLVDSLERGTGNVRGVFVYYDKGTAGAETITAEAAKLIEVPGERRPSLQLANGYRLTLPVFPAAGEPPLPLQSGAFAEATTPLGKDKELKFRVRGADRREMTLVELGVRQGAGSDGQNDIRAEFHKRIVNILTPMLMPILAIPFAIGRQRSQGGYRFGVALVLLILLHEAIEQGAILAQAGLASPLAAIWGPFLAAALFAAVNFYRSCFRLKPDLLEPLAHAASRAMQLLAAPFRAVLRKVRRA